MVKQGRVYVSLPPLYCWGNSNKNYGWCNKVEDIPDTAKDVHRFKGLGEMNDDQLYYFLVDKNTRNVLQIEYPSDIDEFNKILGTSEVKGSLLKDLGIILNSESKVFTNPEPAIKPTAKPIFTEEDFNLELKVEKKTIKKSPAKKIKPAVESEFGTPVATNLFAGLFD
jgi:hypothetical protein